MTDEIAKEAARKKALAYYERAVFLEADPGLLGSLGLFAMLGIAGGLFRLTGGSLDIACLAPFTISTMSIRWFSLSIMSTISFTDAPVLRLLVSSTFSAAPL